MKLFLFIAVIITGLDTSAQDHQIDSLLSLVSNRPLKVHCGSFTVVTCQNGLSGMLIKKATASTDKATYISDQLFKMLLDTSRGIIAHYMLGKINRGMPDSFNERYILPGGEFFCTHNSKGEEEYHYLGLKFFFDKTGGIYTRKRYLRPIWDFWYNWLYVLHITCCVY